jgi:hypothetical protein
MTVDFSIGALSQRTAVVIHPARRSQRRSIYPVPFDLIQINLDSTQVGQTNIGQMNVGQPCNWVIPAGLPKRSRSAFQHFFATRFLSTWGAATDWSDSRRPDFRPLFGGSPRVLMQLRMDCVELWAAVETGCLAPPLALPPGHAAA